jgi:hypothetical protein
MQPGVEPVGAAHVRFSSYPLPGIGNARHAALCRRNQAKCAAHVRVCDLARKKMRVSTTEHPPASRGGKIWRPIGEASYARCGAGPIVSSKYKWISMRCRAGRGRARLFFTLGAVRSGKRDTLLHAAPTRSTELPVRVCDIAACEGASISGKAVPVPENLALADTTRPLVLLHLRRSCFSWTLAALGLLFSRNKELKADAYQVA